MFDYFMYIPFLNCYNKRFILLLTVVLTAIWSNFIYIYIYSLSAVRIRTISYKNLWCECEFCGVYYAEKHSQKKAVGIFWCFCLMFGGLECNTAQNKFQCNEIKAVLSIRVVLPWPPRHLNMPQFKERR